MGYRHDKCGSYESGVAGICIEEQYLNGVTVITICESRWYQHLLQLSIRRDRCPSGALSPASLH
jgi:hypothetical protein